MCSAGEAVTRLLTFALVGGVIGAAAGWQHGLFASVIAAPFGASIFVFLAAMARRGYQAYFEDAPAKTPVMSGPDVGEKRP